MTAMRKYRFDEIAEFECGIVYDLWRYFAPPGGLIDKNPAAWAFAQMWQPQPGTLYVWGSEGVGKSSLCRYLLARMIESGRRVQEVTGEGIENRAWRFEHEREFRRATYSPVLLIDDISNVAWTPRGLGNLRTIIDARHERQKATLVTSNCDSGALFELMTAAMGDKTYVLSLLRRLRPVRMLHMTGESYRSEMG